MYELRDGLLCKYTINANKYAHILTCVTKNHIINSLCACRRTPFGTIQRIKKATGVFDTLHKRHIFCENKFSRKISLRSSKSPYRTFLMAIIQLEVGLFSLRLGHGAALTCHRHVIHSRAAASLPLKLPRCADIFPQQHSFFDSLKKGEKAPHRGASFAYVLRTRRA